MIKGAKKGSQQAHKPHIAKDDLVSTETLNAMYGLCEGEIAGLADGGKSIRLDGTPIINDNGQPNFEGVTYEFRSGTNDQSYIKGFPSVENEIRVGVELRHDRQYVRAINNKELSAVRLRLNFNALRQQHDNGNITGYAIEYAVDVQTDGGAFVQVLTTAVRGKASSGFKRSHRIDLPKASRNWTIRVRRITPNRDSDLIADTMTVDAITEIIDAKLRYPNTAMLAVSYNAKTFSNVAKIAVRLKGKLIQVPSNYDPTARTYTGLWDGTFKLAYSDNPAWVFYDLCTHKRYGLGERLSGMVDKWRLYQIGQYCDEMVDDGMGGREPRFAINVYIQKADDAYRVLQNIASCFRGLSFWDGSQIVLDSDTPKDPVYTFSAVNVVAEFNYQGTRQRDRHTVAKVAWDNPENDYATEYEMVRDEAAIAKYGIRMLDINAFGCTSKGQAQRAGLWALKSEQLETRTVSFKTGLIGFIPQVGQIINIADNVFAGRAVSGRIVSANARQITLDRTAGKIGDTLSINTGGTVKTAKVTAVRGDTLTLDKAIGNADDVWAIVADDLKLMQFRVLTIAQNDDATFDITALQYDRQKYDVVDNGASITQQSYTVLKATPIAAPKSVTITANTRTHQGQAVTTLNIAWEQVQGAVAYIVEWRKDDGNWQTLPKVSGQSADIDGVYSGAYMARVRAVDSFDSESLATSSVLTHITGKQGKPTKLASLTVTSGLFSMALGWIFGAKSEDTNFTEIQVSPDGRSNISTLGTFAYPTNKHEITGLQGNLTQYYRARIVDKLGNTSDWTAWQRGTTSADASKVLDILSGQINQSHLDQTLRAPIAKISGLENTINSELATMTRTLEVEYYLSTSKTVLDGGRWSSQAPRGQAGRYMWSRTKMTLSNGQVQYRPSEQGTCIAGQDGQDGRGIVSITEYYLASVSSSGVHRGMYGWTTSVQQPTESKPFLWNYEQVNYTSGSPSYTEPVMIGKYSRDGRDGATGATGRAGQDGRGIVSVTAEYYLSDSSTRHVGGAWSATTPTWQFGKYIWTRTKIVYSDQKTEYTTPVVSSEWEGVHRELNNRLEGLPDKLEVQEINEKVGNVLAIRGLRIEHNGVISGYGLMSELQNGRATSQFGINADSFYVGSPSSGHKPFATYTQPTVVNGVRIPAGTYINSAFIANASINNAHIANGSIDNAKIANASIDSVKIKDGAIDSAKIGDAAITNAKIGVAQVDTLQIAGQAVVIPRHQYNGANQTWYDVNTEIETNSITINPEGGVIALNISFTALFALPKGIYSWGSFTRAPVGDFHQFLRGGKWTNIDSTDCVAMRIKRDNNVIYEYFFVGNYQKTDIQHLVRFENEIVLYERFSSPTIIDAPNAGEHTYTLTFELVARSTGRTYGDSDRTARPQLHVKGLSFYAMCSKR